MKAWKVRREPAVDKYDLPCHEVRSARSQEYGSSAYFIRFAPASRGCPLSDPAVKFWIVHEPLVHIGSKVSWRYAIYLNVISS